MINNSRIIFYHPKPIRADSGRGSGIRPFRLLNAFKELGYEVTEVVGFSGERLNAIKEVQRFVRAGAEYQFAYGETSNVPIALNNPNRLPLSPFLDFKFFHFLNRQNIPFGMFYRDVFWKFDLFKHMLPWYQRVLSLPFYQLDWILFRKYVNHLFLPSLSMNEFLPNVWPENQVSSLPPGVDTSLDMNLRKTIPRNGTLNCFYVGGIKPPHYDLRDTVKEISKDPSVHFTLCCREGEWRELRPVYQPLMNSNIRVCHKSGVALTELYRKAHVFLLILAPHTYLEFAMPVKLMEAISFGIPVICNSATEYARFVSRNKIGWVIDHPNELLTVLSRLRKNHNEFDKKIISISLLRKTSRWTDRARQVADTLMDYKKNLG